MQYLPNIREIPCQREKSINALKNSEAYNTDSVLRSQLSRAVLTKFLC
jgi:hypothetical protein